MRDAEHLRNLIERNRRAFARKYCLHPSAPSGYSTKIAAAHSVQRALLKKHIAINGHVVQIRASAHVDPVGILIKPEEVGINKATTFNGFCDSHDAALFRPLESSVFEFKANQIALLGYRAVCRELYNKDAEIESAEAVRSYAAVNPDVHDFHEKDQLHRIVQMGRINARMNLAKAKDAYGAMLADASHLRYYAIRFLEAPMYLCAIAFLPEWDFEGRRLQDLSFVAEYKPLCFSAWAAGDHAAAVFCWHESADDICIPFVESLRRIPQNGLANRIMSMAFEHSENVAFRSDWWESISELDRQRIVMRARSGIGPFDRHAESLRDEGMSALQCAIIDEHANYSASANSHF